MCIVCYRKRLKPYSFSLSTYVDMMMNAKADCYQPNGKNQMN